MAEYIEKWSVVNRLIDIENEFQRYKPFHGFEHAMYRKICETEIAIGKMPAADVAPVRHGHWIIPTKISGRAFDIPHCSACDGVPCGVDKNTNFCPNCGADMRERTRENTD